MKKFSLFLILLSIAFCNSANAQENYNPNTYKYRFQKLRSFNTNYNLSSNGQLSNNKETDTSSNAKYINSNRNNNFSLNLGLNYSKSINTESLQHFSELYCWFGFNTSRNNSKIDNKNNYVSYLQIEKQRTSDIVYELGYSSVNKFYSQNKFKYLKYGFDIRNQMLKRIQSGYYNSTSDFEVENTRNYLHLNASLQLGFGTGRLEYVTDPIMAAFILKDLQKKAGIGALTNAQVETIGKGITTIRNKRFIDFRFRLIDQLEMLDSMLQANGIKYTKASRYFTTINDNWQYATRFGRYSGKRWTYYLDNGTHAFNYIEDNSQIKNNIRHTKNTQFNRNLYNGVAINYDQSTQKGIYRQNAWGANITSGLQHFTNGNKFEDSIGLNSYVKTEAKNKPDVINTNIGVYYEYLWQPNTRTFFTARVNPYLSSNISRNGLRKSNPTKIFSNTNNYGLNTDFRYFKFFTARLSTFVNLNFNIYNSRSVYSYEQTPAPSPIITSKNIGNNFNFNHSFSAGITYTLF